jgi:hypothetical protein
LPVGQSDSDPAPPNSVGAAEVLAGTYTLDVNAAGTNQTVVTVPDAALASGGVYSAFTVGTVYVRQEARHCA